MDILNKYHKEFESALLEFKKTGSLKNLYDPMNYIMTMGGKRIRSCLCMLSAESNGIQCQKAIGAAISLEVFHNFTLLHDDIMDNALIRRGMQTVHKKWDINTAILSGDAMLIKSYQFLEDYQDDVFRELIKLLSKTAMEICEGQRLDMDYQNTSKVSQDEYLEMIRLKTAVLIASSLQMGAIIAKASESDKKYIYNFGIQLGLAFQLQDDYLDAFGNEETFGKKIGGDIIENKKTILYHLALKHGSKKQFKILNTFFKNDQKSNEKKIKIVKDLFINTGAKKEVKKMIKYHSKLAEIELEKLSLKGSQKMKFILLKEWLIRRKY